MLKFPHFLLAGALWVSSPLCPSISAQTPLFSASAPRVSSVSGVRREAGAWLFNASIFAAPGENRGLIGGPVFIPNLRRDKKNKLPLFVPSKTGAPVRWSTLPLPDFRTLAAPGFDFSALQTRLNAQVAAARAAGQSYVGWSLPSQSAIASDEARAALPALQRATAEPILKRLRAVLDAVAPDSALVLEVESGLFPSGSALDLDALAPSCDAILLRFKGPGNLDLWPLKMARRVAEEQRDFDLPIFIAPSIAPLVAPPSDPASNPIIGAEWLELFMGGATGFVIEEAPLPSWAGAISRNPGLFAGAVTLEDAAVLPSLDSRTLGMIRQLREAGRVPLVGRLPREGRDSNPRGESLLAILDDQTSLETLSGLDKAAREGNSIYLEGLPNLQNKALLAKISDMTSTTLEILPAPRAEVLTLSDAWLFGDARGREIGVSQRVKWVLKTSLAAQARKKKGEDVLEPLSAAKLAGDANGLLVAPLGKGRITWLAHAPTNHRADEAARRDYYAAIAGSLQGALARVSFDSTEAAARYGVDISLALRASKTGTPIIAVFNKGADNVTLNLAARTDSPIALDLASEREIAAVVSGYSSNVKITVPARGFAWLTFGTTRAALDKERLTPRPKAKNR